MKTNTIFLVAVVAACVVSCSKQIPNGPIGKSGQVPSVAEARAEARKFAGLSNEMVFHLQNSNGKAVDATLQWQQAHVVNGKQATWLRIPIALPIKDAPFSSMAMLFAKLPSGQVQGWLTTENLVRLNDTLRRAVGFYTPDGKLSHAVLLRDEQRKMYRIQLPEANSPNVDRRTGGCTMTGFTVVTVHCSSYYACTVTAHTNFRINCWQINPYDAEGGFNGYNGYGSGQNGGGGGNPPLQPPN